MSRKAAFVALALLPLLALASAPFTGSEATAANATAIHDPQSSSYKADCLTCHADVLKQTSADPRVQTFHNAMLPFTPGFGSPSNLSNVLVAALPLLLLATGQTLVLITGGIDLSVTATVGLGSVVGTLVMGGEAGWLRGSPAAVPAAVAATLATGALVGLLNGACIARLRMPAFMVTLTSTMFFGGLAVWLAKRVVDAESIYGLPPAFLALGGGTWTPAMIAASATLAAHLLLTRTLAIQTILGQSTAYVGFTSGTGQDWGNHDLLSWEYRDSYDPIPVAPPLALMAGGLLAMRWRRGTGR